MDSSLSVRCTSHWLKRQLERRERLLVFQRTWVQFPASTCQLTVLCNFHSRGSDTINFQLSTAVPAVNVSGLKLMTQANADKRPDKKPGSATVWA